MSDPISDLENFSLTGDTLTPLPPSEVRRLGDRMRRRNTTIAAIAGVAAAVLIAVPIAVFAGGSQESGTGPANPGTPAPTTTSVPTTTATTQAPPDEIPDGFPLMPGMYDANTGIVVTERAQLAGDLDYCGETPLAGATTVDSLSAQQAGGETNEVRTLMLFDDAAAAHDAEAALLAAVDACPSGTSGGLDVTNQVLPDAAQWPGHTIQTTYGPEDLRYVLVVRTDRALLLSSSYVVMTPPPHSPEQSWAAIDPAIDAMAEQWGTGEPGSRATLPPSGPAS